MLNAIMKKLNGHGTEAESLAAALEQLGRDRDAVRAEIDGLNQRRHQALLDDASDTVLDKIEREIDRATVRLEKLTLAEQPLRERVAAAVAKARASAEPGLVAEFRAAFTDYSTTLRALAAAHSLQTEIRERARAVLGDARANMLLPSFAYAGVLTHEHITMWIERNEAELRACTGVRPVTTHNSAPRLTRAKAPDRLQHQVRLGQDGSIPKAPRSPDDVLPLEPGQDRVRVLRGGFSPADDRPQCASGQLVRMSREAAEKAALMGAVEIVESSPLMIV